MGHGHRLLTLHPTSPLQVALQSWFFYICLTCVRTVSCAVGVTHKLVWSTAFKLEGRGCPLPTPLCMLGLNHSSSLVTGVSGS